MRTGKPVSRVLSSPARARDGHSSRARRYREPQATDPDRKAGNRPRRDPYLVLLPVGFAVPVPLPVPRCALTAPFHPYRALRRGGLFSVALSIGFEPKDSIPSGRYPAPRFRDARTVLPDPCRAAAAIRFPDPYGASCPDSPLKSSIIFNVLFIPPDYSRFNQTQDGVENTPFREPGYNLHK